MENEDRILLEPVTAIIVRQVKPQHLRNFEEWAQGMDQVAMRFDGFLGATIIRPRDNENLEYVIVIRFDNYDHLRVFLASPERNDFLLKSENFTIGEMSVQEMQGLESFFSLPDKPPSVVSPARYKMAILTIIALYPPLIGLSTLMAFIFRGLPRPWLVLLTLLVLVPLMTYFIMPWVTKLFRFWLYPKSVTA